MSLDRERQIDESWATYKAAVRESELIILALEKKRARVRDDIEAIQATIRCIPTWHDSGDEVAGLIATEQRLWAFVRILDGMIAAQLKIQDKARRLHCAKLEE